MSLKDGVFGSRIVAYFEGNNEVPPTDALFMEAVSRTETIYRLTFPDGSVWDSKIVFDKPATLGIETIELFDQVI